MEKESSDSKSLPCLNLKFSEQPCEKHKKILKTEKKRSEIKSQKGSRKYINLRSLKSSTPLVLYYLIKSPAMFIFWSNPFKSSHQRRKLCNQRNTKRFFAIACRSHKPPQTCMSHDESLTSWSSDYFWGLQL